MGGSGQSEQNCQGSSPSGLAPVEAGFCTTLARHFELLPAGLVPVEARFADWRMADSWANRRSSGASPEGTMLSSACGSAETRAHRHEAGGGNAIPQRQPPIRNWTDHENYSTPTEFPEEPKNPVVSSLQEVVDLPECPPGPGGRRTHVTGMLGKTRRTRRGPASHSDTATPPIIVNGVA